MTVPLTPAGCDLRDFPHTPLFRSRLFGSSFHARATDSEWRAGVTLWLKSWDQVPAGSLPDDDVELCRLAELARDIKTWKRVREGSLRGWFLCADGRLYHPVVAEGINNAIEAKATQRAKTAKARIAALEKHLTKAVSDNDADAIERIKEELRKLRQPLLQPTKSTPTESVTGSVTDSKRREGEGKEKGEGRDSSSEAIASAAGAAEGGAERQKSPEDQAKSDLWKAAVAVLLEGGCKSEAVCRSFMGKLVGDYTVEVVRDAVAAAATAQPADARDYLKATCQRMKGERPAEHGKPITVPSKDIESTQAWIATHTAPIEETPETRAAVADRLRQVANKLKGIPA